MKLNQKIVDFLKPNKKDVTRILSAIKRYDRIAIFRHSKPDFDALGSQMGLAIWLKDNFPNKEIRVLGDNHVTFTPRLYPEMSGFPFEIIVHLSCSISIFSAMPAYSYK